MTNDENVNKLIGLFVYHKSKGRTTSSFPLSPNNTPSAPSSSSSTSTSAATTSNTTSDGVMDIETEKEEEKNEDKDKDKEKEGQKENGKSSESSSDGAAYLNQKGKKIFFFTSIFLFFSGTYLWVVVFTT